MAMSLTPEYVRLNDGCGQKAFRQSADLDRHIKHVHSEPSDVHSYNYNQCPKRGKAEAASTSSTSQSLEAVASPGGSSSDGGRAAAVGAFGRKDH